MTFTDEEQALHTALADVTIGQPPMPVDRIAGVRRRHTRRRAAQLSGAAVVMVAAVIGTVLGAGQLNVGSRHATPVQQPPASWQLPWAERSDGTVDQKAALASFEDSHGVKTSGVRWLYAATPADMNVRFAVFEATFGNPQIHQLVGLASPDDGLSWTSYIDSPPPPATKAVGFAWESREEGHKVVVLAAPGPSNIGLVDLTNPDSIVHQEGAPVADAVSVYPLDHALVPNTLFVGEPDYASTYPVLFAEGAPRGPQPDFWQQDPTPPAGNHEVSFLSGQGGTDTLEATADREGEIVVTIRCGGPNPMLVSITDGSRTTSSSQSRCDGSVGTQATGFVVKGGDKLTITGDAPAATIFSIGVYESPVGTGTSGQ